MVASPVRMAAAELPSSASWSVAACLARALAGFLQRLQPLLGPVERFLHLVIAVWNSWLSR
jgi:hypothetical protein